MTDLAEIAAAPMSETPKRSLAEDFGVASIAGLWRFRLDATMKITLILPPGGADVSQFPCGGGAHGRRLFDVLDVAMIERGALDFARAFKAHQDIKNCKFVRRRASGEYHTLIISGVAVFNEAQAFQGYHCTVADITAAAGAGPDTRHQAAALDAFIRHLPNLVVVKDVEGRFLAVNPLAERSYGVPGGQLLGKTAEEALSQSAAAECSKEDMTVLGKEATREVEQTFQWPDGPHTFHTVKFPIFDPDRILVGVGAIGIDITQRKRIEAGLYQRANFDPVTDLPNRRLTMDRLDQAMALARRTRAVVGVMMLDVGDFTEINEALGHVEADWLLINTANTLRGLCRETDTVGRLSGDTFCIVLPNLKNVAELERVAEKVLKGINKIRAGGENQVALMPSIGTAIFSIDADQSEDLIACAKLALDHAKQQGRNRSVHFNSALSGPNARRRKIANQLRQAIVNNELTLAYQPIIDAKSGRTVSVEALARWTSSELGVVPPDEFIPIAEDTGLIGDLGAWVFRTACTDAKTLNPPGAPPIVVAVNFSVKQLADKNVVKMVEAAIAEVGIDPRLMKVEMTETAFADDVTTFQNALEGFRGLGVGTALDDFGTGYSSLAYLNKYRFTQLKIDKSFVCDVVSNEDGRLLVESIIRMAHNLRLEIVAEGVETEDQVTLLSRLGCDQFQGYFVSRPISLAEMEELLEMEKSEFVEVA